MSTLKEVDMRHPSDYPVWLTLVALDARDSLRARIIPALDRAASMVVEPETQRLLRDIRDQALLQCNRLRLAIKGRAPGSQNGRRTRADRPILDSQGQGRGLGSPESPIRPRASDAVSEEPNLMKAGDPTHGCTYA